MARKTKYDPETFPALEKYSVKSILKETQRYFFEGDEKAFEKHILDNIEDICKGLNLSDIVKVFRQKQIKVQDFYIRPDLIVMHKDESLTIIEVKKTNQRFPHLAATEQAKGIGQCLLYKSILSVIYNRKTRVILVDEKIHPRTMYMFSENDLPISLMEIQKDRVFCPRLRL